MKRIFTLFFLISSVSVFANKSAAAIYVDLQKLNSLDKILYVAAHPDDENTRALAWFSLGLHAETAYFSLTRGDGGQNLIGKELSEDLGVLRTQELLAARSYDGAKQYFSRAVDFGYSKSAEESFEKWGKEDILAETVLMIRKFQPHVIITRFPPDNRAGHGHHSASAILAIEAFEKAANPNYLPEQVKEFGTWQASSLYWNTSPWSNPNMVADAQKNPEIYIVKDIGGYNELLGMSYNEIGTIARSQHKCQGFGALIEKGSTLEYFEYLAGENIEEDFFENNTKTWSAVLNNEVENQFETLLKDFDFIKAENNIPALFNILKELKKLPESTFKTEKTERCQQIILDCLGLDIEIMGKDYAYTSNEKSELSINAINRSSKKVVLNSVESKGLSKKTLIKELKQNEMLEEKISFTANAELSTPYWLEKPFTDVFTVTNKNNLLKAENTNNFNFQLELEIEEEILLVEVPLEFKVRDPSYGERRREGVSTPDFTVNFNEKTIILREGQSKTIELKVHAFKENINDELIIEAPFGWNLNQTKFPINLKNKNEDYFVKIILTPTKESKRGFLKIKNSKGEEIKSYTEIAYDHIATQVIFKTSQLECVKIDAQIKPGKIAYIKGAEDLVPEAIAQLGFEVDVFEVENLSSVDFAQYQSIVLGIRIYNVKPELRNFEKQLFTYVENGGNLIMQYNTASRANPNAKYGGPLAFELSRNRVTEEDAPVKFLAPKHPIMNYPNKITQVDFEDWVQERGLYFAGNWDKKYIPLFSWHDKGESEQLGAIIVANHGKGQFIYTGISFFRELPNGVEGAYRLFANLLSYESK